jgi:ribosomal protein L37AE/L43A
MVEKRLVKGLSTDRKVPLSAAGAPVGYRYGDTVVCPKCGRKELVWRTRDGFWKCGYVFPEGDSCGYYSSYYVGVHNKKKLISKTNSSSTTALDFMLCAELVRGKVFDPNEVEEICGVVDDRRLVNKSSNRDIRDSMLPGDAIRNYRRKLGTAG